MKLLKSLFIITFLTCVVLRELGYRPVHTMLFVSSATLCGFMSGCYTPQQSLPAVQAKGIAVSGSYRFYSPTGEESAVELSPDKVTPEAFSSSSKPTP